MSAQTQALLTFVVSVGVFTLLIQRARRRLNGDQLFALERIDAITWRSFIPIIPLLVALAMSYVPGIPMLWVFWLAFVFFFALFLLDAWSARRRILAAGLPTNYANAHLAGRSILTVGVAVALVFIARGTNWNL